MVRPPMCWSCQMLGQISPRLSGMKCIGCSSERSCKTSDVRTILDLSIRFHLFLAKLRFRVNLQHVFACQMVQRANLQLDTLASVQISRLVVRRCGRIPAEVAISVTGGRIDIAPSARTLRKRVRLAFPSLAPSEAARLLIESRDFEIQWCAKALLQLPWQSIPSEVLLRNRECPIYLTPEQCFHALPAYLVGALKMTERDPSNLFFDYTTYLILCLAPHNGMLEKANTEQCRTIGQCLQRCSEHASAVGEPKESATLKENAIWWLEHGLE